MQFNDTTNYDGLVQHFEKWTRQTRGTVSGSTTLLKEFTSEVNSTAFPELLPMLLAYNDQVRWDDLNNTDAPRGKVNIVANQNDYKITADADSYDILNITGVRILQSATATRYYPLERITLDDPRVPLILSPDTSITGVPTAFLEVGNTVYFDVIPNYSASLGLQLFFGRQQQYFLSSDTTKKPGIPLPFHILLALKPALNWNSINRADDTNLLTILTNKIAKVEANLDTMIKLRHPSRTKLTHRPIQYL